MKFMKLAFAGLIFSGAASLAHAGETGFKGEAYGSVNTQTYEAVTTYIYGATAEAIFTTTAAMARIENVSPTMRRVVGDHLICFEKFPDDGTLTPIVYTCKFIVQQAGKIVRPPLSSEK